MGTPYRSNINGRRQHETMRLAVTTFTGVVFGFFLGASFPTISLSKVHIPPKLLPPINLAYVEDKYSDISTQTLVDVWSSFKGDGYSSQFNKSRMFAPKNPRGTKTLPPGIVTPESDYYLRRMWGRPNEDLIIKPRYLVTFTVGLDQKDNINAAVKKMSENFSILLFHYDGLVSEWDQFEWSKTAIHVSIHKQTKWWYAKRFLHPDIVAPYDYIFIWDEDLGVDNFDFEKFVQQIRKHGLEISQPGLAPKSGLTWQMTRMQKGKEVHKTTREKKGYCSDPHKPPCAAFVEIMAPVFSRNAWRCVWHMLQNDLVHGWGLDFALRRCVEPAHEKIGVVDSQYIVHQSKPSLGNQGESTDGKAPWEGVRDRCTKEWRMFQDRMADAEKAYFENLGIKPPNLKDEKWNREMV